MRVAFWQLLHTLLKHGGIRRELLQTMTCGYLTPIDDVSALADPSSRLVRRKNAPKEADAEAEALDLGLSLAAGALVTALEDLMKGVGLVSWAG